MNVAVVGLGYVGLPLALLLSSKGFKVLAIDKNTKKIAALQKGVLPFAEEEPHLKNYFINSKKTSNITYSLNFNEVKSCEITFIAVDTPAEDKVPDYKTLKDALESVAKNIQKNSIIIVESTLSPKTTQNLVIPTIEKMSNLEANKDFFVAVVPERIRPNHIFKQLTTLSRVIGLSSPKVQPRLKKMYKKITKGQLDFVDTTTAETVKAVENTFRDVNIALANQIAMACEDLGVNVWKIQELVNKSPFHNLHSPGAGVGGHCIPKDPWLLISSVKKGKLPIVELSRKTNDEMPEHIFNIAKKALSEKGIELKKAQIRILGYSYVEDSDDTRNSPTGKLELLLKKYKVPFKTHDPHVEGKNSNIDQFLKKSDCIILMVAHSKYKQLTFEKLKKLLKTTIIIDGRNFFDSEKAIKNGFTYKGIGNIKNK